MLATSDGLTMTDGERLLRRILECPEDDAVRLIYSDWLEEQGEEERARFIRLQIDLTNCTSRTARKRVERKIDDLMMGVVGWRKWEWTNWILDVACLGLGVDGHKNLYLDIKPGSTKHHGEVMVQRGFISEARLTCAAFVGGPCERCVGGEYAEQSRLGSCIVKCDTCSGTGRIEGVARELFSRHPITEVRLVDRKPYADAWFQSGQWRSGQHPESDIPKELMVLMAESIGWDVSRYIQFDREADANAALSRACVSYGRSLVGLPMLERE